MPRQEHTVPIHRLVRHPHIAVTTATTSTTAARAAQLCGTLGLLLARSGQ
jgi:hypothetical protein